MAPLFDVLTRPIPTTHRTRAYQAALDHDMDRIAQSADMERGLAYVSPSVHLPHEDTPQFWELSGEERARRTSPEAQKAYAAHLGRAGTAPLGLAAFCWRSPLSRHHRDTRLLRFFLNGLTFFLDAIRDDGVCPMFGDGVEGWSQGWDVESLIYGLILCEGAIELALMTRAKDRFRRAAARFAGLPQTFNTIGSYGNQRCVYTLGLNLYGQFLGDGTLLAQSDRLWEDAMPKVLDEAGQVIEQHGPCMHYSHTAFIYSWLNLAVRGDESQLDRIQRCLDWFRARHTQSLYPLAGPSTRQYYEKATAMITDLWPAAEQVAHRDSSLREFVDRVMARVCQPQGEVPARLDQMPPIEHGSHHALSPLMWAMLMTRDDRPAQAPAPREPMTHYYETTTLHRRCPIKYVLVRRTYQTHFNVRDFLPFAGIQTWAIENEPPIIHPTPLAPSTTQAYGLDTARQGTSMNWGLFGAGAMAADAILVPPKSQGSLHFLLARYNWLWRFVFFTDRSTVVLEFGRGGPRRTLWTLNRLDPAEPEIATGVVRFAGRRACLHSTAPKPRLVALDDGDPWLKDVRQLEYDCGEGAAAFAFSDDSFRFDSGLPPESIFRFADSCGRYEAVLNARFHEDNPGCIRIDPWRLAHDTAFRRVSG